MAKIGRNQPCPCGLGIKAKRCCGVSSGPSEDELATAFLHAQARHWAPLLAGASDDQLHDTLNEVLLLPRADICLQARLPRLLPPALERLGQAIAGGDPEAVAAALPTALAAIDTPGLRAHLARSVLSMHELDLIDDDVAACAIIDLATPRPAHSALVGAALTEALAVRTGTNTTPSGLVVASR